MREQYARRESLAVVATALVHLLSWSWPVVHAVLMTTATVGWAVWMTLKFRGDAEARRAMGLGRRGLKETWWLMLPLGSLSVLVIAVIALAQAPPSPRRVDRRPFLRRHPRPVPRLRRSRPPS